ncbi:hypothetical protein FACS1894163_09260 [Spirochaetia bacterium]|nr:hypothetical protein FACS1894163_09260 [Spirochaetia bacterium]
MRFSVSIGHADYSVFTREQSPYWQAKFWDHTRKQWAACVSTKVKKTSPKREAEKVAADLLRQGILTQAQNTDIGFLEYLTFFWQPTGDYCRLYIQNEGKAMSSVYVKTAQGDIRLHVATYPQFKKMRLADITTRDLEHWLLWARETHGISGDRVNSCLKWIKTALAQAAERGDISADPSKPVKQAAHIATEKGILTQAEAAAICALPLDNPRRQLAVLLGLCCGMRRGEVRGLQWGDIGDGLIHIRHNYVPGDREKTPKCGSTRTVPFGAAVGACLEAVRATARHTAPDAYILESLQRDGQPISATAFTAALGAVLASIDIDAADQKKRNLTFHGLRHSFVSLGRLNGIDDLTIQTLAGHKSGAMMSHYTHAAQAIDFTAAREKLAGVWTRRGA